jgi:ABC-2 type transport system permease protein
MRKVFDIAAREFRHTVITKAFVLAAIVFPALMWGMAIVLPMMLHTPTPPLEGVLAVVDPDGRIAAALVAELDPQKLHAEHEASLAQLRALMEKNIPAGYRSRINSQLEELLAQPEAAVTVEVHTDAAQIEALKVGVREGRFVALASFAPALLGTAKDANHYDLFVGESLTRKHTEFITDKLEQAARTARCAALAIDAEQARAALARPDAVMTTLTKQGGEAPSNGVAEVLMPLGFMLMLWMSTMLTGNYLLTSVIEEKSNKVMEVLLSAVSPMELMAGKVAGQCMVGLVLVGLYGGVGVATAGNLGYAHLVPTDKLAYLVLYFLMAYFMVGSAMAAVGSAVNELREAQTLMGPLTMVFMIPFFAWFFISDNPNSTFATVLSFIPPLTPFTMILRVTAKEAVPLWQILASFVVGLAGVVSMVWMASRVFRVGVLMYGKPPTPRELLKWIRYS